MYACLHAFTGSYETELLDLSLKFSPTVERTSEDTIVFSIDALRKLIGSPHQIASEICRYGDERKIRANLAIASSPDAAILIARNIAGVTLVTPGEERFKIAPIPLSRLLSHDVPLDPALLDIFTRWGLKTCEDLAALPEIGIAERMGPPGIYLRNLARGKIDRPLRMFCAETNYQEQVDLEHPIELLEPLLFLFGRALSDLCTRLRSQSRAARLIEVKLNLEGAAQYTFQLEFPIPLSESKTMLKLLQLHLERHPPAAPILRFTLRIEPIEPRRAQGGLFVPPTPQPDKLQITLARIASMVGEPHVGTPALLNTHRPDAFQMTMPNFAEQSAPMRPADQRGPSVDPRAGNEIQTYLMIRLALRLYRPSLHARVKTAGLMPKKITATGVRGNVVRAAGPWKISGDWWTSTPWNREEWDVALDDGALYRIYCELQTSEWFVFGVYD